MNTWEKDLITAFESLGGSASYEDLYSEIQNTRKDLPKTWKAVIRRNIQNLSSDSAGFKNGKDLFFSVDGLGGGIWGLRSFLTETPIAIDIPKGTETPNRVNSKTYRILRDTNLARKLKLLHKNKCQICNTSLKISSNKTYSEAHHIKPLGGDHNGPDIPENIIILCPNCHTLCDYGAIKINLSKLNLINGHQIGLDYVEYHNTKIFLLLFEV